MSILLAVLGVLATVSIMICIPGGVVVFVMAFFQKDLLVKRKLQKWSLYLILTPIILLTIASGIQAFK